MQAESSVVNEYLLQIRVRVSVCVPWLHGYKKAGFPATAVGEFARSQFTIKGYNAEMPATVTIGWANRYGKLLRASSIVFLSS